MLLYKKISLVNFIKFKNKLLSINKYFKKLLNNLAFII